MSNGNVRGRFLWHELLTSDPAAAIAYYSKVVGWKKETWGPDESYQMLAGPGGAMAGVLALPEEAKDTPPHWLTYIGTPDIDATCKKAVDLGAEVLHGPMDVPTVGRMAVLLDPQGAVFAVYAPAQPSAGGEPKLGEFSWHELSTTDTDAAWTFYSTLFGWQKAGSMDMGGSGVYQMFGRDGHWWISAMIWRREGKNVRIGDGPPR